MNETELGIVLMVGTLLMCVPIAVQMRWYGITAWKSIIVAIALVIAGLEGSRFWFFVENGYFMGRSFYGAIFIAPIVFFPIAKIIKIPYAQILDFIAPAGCLTLALVKIQCLRDGCCVGKILYLDENSAYVRFPSQIAEMIAFLLIAVALMIISKSKKGRGKVFPMFLILYGATRFVLNSFREENAPYALGLTAGAFWSLCGLLIGGVALTVFAFIEKERE